MKFVPKKVRLFLHFTFYLDYEFVYRGLYQILGMKKCAFMFNLLDENAIIPHTKTLGLSCPH